MSDEEIPEGTFFHYVYRNGVDMDHIPLCIRLNKCAMRNQVCVGKEDWRKVTCPECITEMYHRDVSLSPSSRVEVVRSRVGPDPHRART